MARWRVHLAALGTVAALAGCQPAVPDAATGKSPRIVSLNPCTDAVLAEVTAPGQLLAISAYSSDPASSSMGADKAARYRAISGTVEEIAALHPDLVVASTFMPPATLHALQDMGIPVAQEGIVSDIAGAREQVQRLARLARDPSDGAALLGRIDAALARSAPPPGWRAQSALVWQSGGLVAGGDTLVMDLMRHAGFTDAASARGLSQAEYLPLERVLADPPQVIFAAGNARAEADRLLHHPALGGLAGTPRFRLDPSLLWCAGPSVPRLLDRLTEARATISADQPRTTR